MTYRGHFRNKIAPTAPSGNLYCVRLKTDVGILYKIGFTTLSSVEERFAFKGDGREKLIHRTLLSVRLENAYHVEQELHSLLSDERLFGSYSRNPYMPLFGNGQSELYASDVLKLDDEFTDAQEVEARERIKRRYGENQVPPSAKERLAKMVATGIGMTLGYGLAYPIGKIVFLVNKKKILEERARDEAKRAREEARRLRRLEEIVAMLGQQWNLQQIGKLHRT